MIYITGDCHADWRKFSTQSFPEQTGMGREDYVIVCGDFGIWHDTAEERWWLDWMSKKNFTILFVDGNHENFDRLYNEFDVVDFHGGKAHKIRDNIYHLMRGYVFELCGKSIFAFGGASSHDIRDGILDRNDFDDEAAFRRTIRKWNTAGKMFRVNHESWWKEELPNRDEIYTGIQNLKTHNNRVDMIISHCCPQTIADIILANVPYDTGMQSDRLTEFFDQVCNTVDFDKWYFGHYHNNSEITRRFTLLYEQIVRVV